MTLRRNEIPTDAEVREHIANIRARGAGDLADLIERNAFRDRQPQKYTCGLCKDTGFIEWTEERGGIRYEFAEPCICLKRKRELTAMQTSSLPDTERMNLGTYKATEDWQVRVLDSAYLFAGWSPKAADEIPPWFFVGGQTGAGKTHICTGICMNLIGQGRRVVYRIWADLLAELTEKRNRPEYRETMKRLIDTDVLYLDDLLRGNPSRAAVEIAWEIINGRYVARNKQTVISSEHYIQELIEIDAGLGGRINERSRGFNNGIKRDNARDYRTKGGTV